ncbi:MAG: AAA family ATPase [Rhodospirillales bacterium]
MIRTLWIDNFKSWRDTGELSLAPVTALFGANSSGKTSLLQFLLMLKQTKDTTDRSLALDFGGDGMLVNLGSYSDCLHKHSRKAQMSWTLEWNLPKLLEITNPEASKKSVLFKGDEIGMEVYAAAQGKTCKTTDLKYYFADREFSISEQDRGVGNYKLTLDGSGNGNGKKFKFRRQTGRAWDLPGPVKSYAFPDQARTYHQNADFLSDFELAYESLMDHIFYLGPLRDFPRREYVWSGTRPLGVGVSGERVVDAILAATAAKEQRNRGPKQKLRPFQEFIAEWLKELGLIHSFSVEEIGKDSNLYRVKVKSTSASAPVLITDVGFGVSQFLPVLVLLYYAPKNSVVLLEQPELHLHPSVQSTMADVIINATQTRDIQVIVESHSEHFLRRLQRRTAEEKISHDHVKVYFCRNAGKASEIEEIRVDEYGNIQNWPENFFGDEFGEIAAIAEAGIAAKRSAK